MSPADRWRRRIRWGLWITATLAVALALLAGLAWFCMIRMPGESHRGDLAPLSPEQMALEEALRRDVFALAGEIGERNELRPERLERAQQHVEAAWRGVGLAVRRQGVCDHGVCANLEVEIPGVGDEIVVVGAHVDTVPDTPGADDNASGVAALLALGRMLAGEKLDRTLRLVAFANEEPPFFQTERMGSLIYARACQARNDRIVAMVALEMLGFYVLDEGSQRYPPPLSWFYPRRGDFIAFVGNLGSRGLVRDAIGSFRRRAQLPSEGVAIFGWLPGIGFSDHWSFWQVGVPAIMVTDTAFFRNRHYHGRSDTPERLDYGRMARVVAGLRGVIVDLCTR